jgi:hypothetical protein
MRIRLERIDVERNPYLIWNSFIGLIATDYDELEPSQRFLHLVFVYESEVQNGGHLQYFENFGTIHLADTLEALIQVGAACQSSVLQGAGKQYLSRPRRGFKCKEEYVAAALEDEFGPFDIRFHRCLPDLIECLEAELKRNQDRFIEIVG